LKRFASSWIRSFGESDFFTVIPGLIDFPLQPLKNFVGLGFILTSINTMTGLNDVTAGDFL
jgi:hypothetical protein